MWTDDGVMSFSVLCKLMDTTTTEDGDGEGGSMGAERKTGNDDKIQRQSGKNVNQRESEYRCENSDSSVWI